MSEIKVQSSFSSTSLIETYVIKKNENEEKFLQTLNKILIVLDSFNQEEHRCFRVKL